MFTHQIDFFGRPYFGFRGCCALKFLYALENDQGLLAHTPPGMGVFIKIFLQWVVKNWLKIQRIRAHNLGVRESDATELCHMACHNVGIIAYEQLFGAPPA